MTAPSEKELFELAPLAALGALDGEEQQAFARALQQSPSLQGELLAFERVVALLPLALAPVQPRPATRERVLETQGSRRSSRPAPQVTWLAAAAAVLLAVSSLVLRGQRDAAQDQARVAREQAAGLAETNRRLTQELDSARIAAAEARSVRNLIATPGLRVVSLSGQKPAPGARARALYDPVSREAWLLVSGLERAPAGKAYEVWVIAGPAPTPAGTFQVDEQGQALVRLPALEETAKVKTFAVSLEPEWGVPAPTGPIVLAGNALP